MSTPLYTLNHYVVGFATPAVAVPPADESFDAFYSRLGRTVVYTVVDGDCLYDALTISCGLNQGFEGRCQLRCAL
mgnify:CR=1 FL=1